MNHPEREEWIPLLFGEADAPTRERLEAHLKSCAACAQEVNGWRRSIGRLDAWKLPKPQKFSSTLTLPPLAWAAAAAIVIAAFGIGRLSAPALDAQKLRADLKSELSAEIQQGLALASSDSSRAMADLEVHLASASVRDREQLTESFVGIINDLRAEDREATEDLFAKIQKQYSTDFVLLRRDLETLASTTDEEIEDARLRLYQLASNRNP